MKKPHNESGPQSLLHNAGHVFERAFILKQKRRKIDANILKWLSLCVPSLYSKQRFPLFPPHCHGLSRFYLPKHKPGPLNLNISRHRHTHIFLTKKAWIIHQLILKFSVAFSHIMPNVVVFTVPHRSVAACFVPGKIRHAERVPDSWFANIFRVCKRIWNPVQMMTVCTWAVFGRCSTFGHEFTIYIFLHSTKQLH